MEANMNYLKRSKTNVLMGLIAVIALIAVAVWQFILFAGFKNAQGVLEVDGGGHHFWWGLTAAIIACSVGFWVFSVYLRYDKSDELHITS